MQHSVFLDIDTSTTQDSYTVSFSRDSDLNHKVLRVHWYTVENVAVSAGAPYTPYFNVVFLDAQSSYVSLVRSDNRAGVPLPLTGAFTSKDPPIPMNLIHNIQANGTFRIKFTDKDGNNLVASRVSLYCSTV